MRFKGLVKFFTIVLILISIYQLSFTFVVNNVEDNIETEATQWVQNKYPSASEKYPDNRQEQVIYQDFLDSVTRERVQFIEDSTSTKIVYNTLVKEYTLPEAKAEQLGLGLDLKGGMNVVLRVSLKDLIRKMANNTSDKTFNRALDMAVKQQATTSTNLITLFYQNWNKIKSPDDRLAPLFSSAFQDKIDFNTTDEEVIDVVSDEAKNA